MQLPRRLAIGASLAVSLWILAMQLGSPPAGAYQYVMNGSFESGADGWAISPGAEVTAVSGDGPAIDGATSAKVSLTGGGTNFTLRQTFVEPAAAGTYHVSLYVWPTSSYTVLRVEIESDPAVTTFEPVTVPQVAGQWLHVEADVEVTGSASIKLKVVGQGVAGDVVYVDDVRFEGAPPATMTPTNTPVPPTPTDTPIPPTPTKTATPTKTPITEESRTPDAPGAYSGGGFVNGGFEDVAEGAPAGWEKYGGSLSSATSPVRSGGMAARFESTTESTKWAFQTVAVTGGGTYAFDAWLLQNDANVASAFLRVSWYASDDGSGTAIGTADSTSRIDAPSGEWRYLTTGAVAAPPEARSAKLRIMMQPSSGAPATIYIDDAAFSSADPLLASDRASSGAGSAANDVGPAPHVAGASRRPASRTEAPDGVGAPAFDARVSINEVLYDPAEGDDAAGEWVELYNSGDLPVSLEGWALADNRSVDALDAVTVPARGYLIVAASQEFGRQHPEVTAPVHVLDGRIGNSLGNDGDVLVLLDPSGRFVDAVSWGTDTGALDPPVADVPAGHSIERRVAGGDTDRGSDWVDNESPSPGAPFALPGESALSRPGRTEIIAQESGFSFAWLPWALAAFSMATLAGVASWRIFPALAGRLRQE